MKNQEKLKKLQDKIIKQTKDFKSGKLSKKTKKQFLKDQNKNLEEIIKLSNDRVVITKAKTALRMNKLVMKFVK